MNTATIDLTPAAAPIVPSSDAAYDIEAALGQRTRFRWKQTLTDLRAGVAFPGGERMGYVFGGFVSTQQQVLGNTASFRMGGTTITFAARGDRVKERIRFATLAAATARLAIRIVTQDCHVEQAAGGGLVVWSDLDGSVLATIPAPTCMDARGAMGPANYALDVTGALTLELDAAWLAAATYPVFIDPTTVVASVDTHALSLPRNGKIFRLSDGRLVAFVYLAGTGLVRSSSTDAGVTWSATVTITAAALFPFAVCQNGDTIYGMYVNSSVQGIPFKTVYSAGAFTDTLGGNVAGDATTITALDMRYDSVKGNLHVLRIGGTSGHQLFAISTALAAITNTAALTATVGSCALAIDAAATPNLYAVSIASGGGLVNVVPITWNGATYTVGGAETTGDANNYDIAVALDSSANLDIFFVNVSGALKTTKRTGINTFSGFTTLVASGMNTAFDGVGVSRTGNANADIFVVYRYNGAQSNGEIYYVKRTAGAWGTGTLVAGGANTGWASPSAIDLIGADNKVNMLYLTASSTVTYDGSLLTGTAPSAPINVLPSGNANTSTTPTCSATYKNTQASDNLGKYRVLVTRVSDAAVFWDTGAGGTAYGGATIVDGGTFSIVYAGTALVKGTQYNVQLQFWDALLSSSGPLSTAVGFSVNDAPAVAITSSATPASSGPAVTWTYSQAQGHAQASYRVTVTRAGVQVHDSGVVSSAALTYTLPNGTLVNGVAHTITLTALSTDGL